MPSHGYTQVTYGKGAGGRGPSYSPAAFISRLALPRAFNQVWHQAGYKWGVRYVRPTGQSCVVINTNNPTRCGNGTSSDVYAYGDNYTDDSGTHWTEQTTIP